jgi:hypothetical protein
MRDAIRRGQADGQIHGKFSLLSPIYGAIRAWVRTTIQLLREDWHNENPSS